MMRYVAIGNIPELLTRRADGKLSLFMSKMYVRMNRVVSFGWRNPICKNWVAGCSAEFLQMNPREGKRVLLYRTFQCLKEDYYGRTCLVNPLYRENKR